VIGLDTNIVIRYLTQDDQRQSQRANRLFERTLSAERPGFVSLVVLCEVVWVLADSYAMDAARIRAVVEGLLESRQLEIESKELVRKALRSWSSGPTGLTDALIGELGLGAGADYTATFDKAAARLPAFKLLA
jgi:predicted nucleic-acid-binding protein